MIKGIIVLLIIITVLCGVLGYLYYKYDMKVTARDESTTVNILIEEDGDLIKTGYSIFYELGERQGESYKLGPVVEKFSFNSSLKICNRNLEGQNYYTICKHINTIETNTRLKMEVEQPHPINITQEGEFEKDKKIKLKLDSKYLRDLKVCVKYSIHFITVGFEGVEKIGKPDEFKNYDKCYNLNYTLEDNKVKVLNLTYSSFGVLNKDRDYVRLVFYTTDVDYMNETYIKSKFEHKLII